MSDHRSEHCLDRTLSRLHRLHENLVFLAHSEWYRSGLTIPYRRIAPEHSLLQYTRAAALTDCTHPAETQALAGGEGTRADEDGNIACETWNFGKCSCHIAVENFPLRLPTARLCHHHNDSVGVGANRHTNEGGVKGKPSGAVARHREKVRH